MVKCKICELEFISFLALGKHLGTHNISLQDYYDKYLEGKKTCENCGSEVPFKSLSYGYQRFCCLDCAYKFRIGKKRDIKEKSEQTIECKICRSFVVSLKALSQHIRFHNISSQEYYDKYLLKDSSEKLCSYCGKDTKFKSLTGGYQTYCSSKCCNKSEEKISKFRESYLSNDLQEIHKKRQTTNLERYGNEIANRNDEIREKSRINFLKGTINKKLQYLDEWDLKLISNRDNYTYNDILIFKCNKCNKEFESTFSNIWQRMYKCYCQKPRSGSINENKIKDFLLQTFSNEEIIFNEKIDGLEIDILFPNRNIAIEYNGLYWHSDRILKDPKTYHITKKKICKNKGIKLIQIFEDEWIEKEHIVKNRILHILKLSTNEKIYARKCVIKEISYKDKKEFLKNYHIQGNDSSSINLGAFYNNELVSVMTFSKGSIAKGSKYKEGNWELSRFCLKDNILGPGIASKLLSHFKKIYSWKYIYSYADQRWSDGELYYKIGFNLEYETKPNYWYTKDGLKRIHRFNLRKQSQEPKDIPEWILRDKQGYYRVWDCGNLKFSTINGGI